MKQEFQEEYDINLSEYEINRNEMSLDKMIRVLNNLAEYEEKIRWKTGYYQEFQEMIERRRAGPLITVQSNDQEDITTDSKRNDMFRKNIDLLIEYALLSGFVAFKKDTFSIRIAEQYHYKKCILPYLKTNDYDYVNKFFLNKYVLDQTDYEQNPMSDLRDTLSYIRIAPHKVTIFTEFWDSSPRYLRNFKEPNEVRIKYMERDYILSLIQHLLGYILINIKEKLAKSANLEKLDFQYEQNDAALVIESELSLIKEAEYCRMVAIEIVKIIEEYSAKQSKYWKSMGKENIYGYTDDDNIFVNVEITKDNSRPCADYTILYDKMRDEFIKKLKKCEYYREGDHTEIMQATNFINWYAEAPIPARSNPIEMMINFANRILLINPSSHKLKQEVEDIAAHASKSLVSIQTLVSFLDYFREDEDHRKELEFGLCYFKQVTANPERELIWRKDLFFLEAIRLYPKLVKKWKLPSKLEIDERDTEIVSKWDTLKKFLIQIVHEGNFHILDYDIKVAKSEYDLEYNTKIRESLRSMYPDLDLGPELKLIPVEKPTSLPANWSDAGNEIIYDENYVIPSYSVRASFANFETAAEYERRNNEIAVEYARQNKLVIEAEKQRSSESTSWSTWIINGAKNLIGPTNSKSPKNPSHSANSNTERNIKSFSQFDQPSNSGSSAQMQGNKKNKPVESFVQNGQQFVSRQAKDSKRKGNSK